MRVYGDWLLTAERAAVHGPTRTAVLADLHLGYAQARCRQGEAVPEFGLDETVACLGSLLARHEVRRLVIAGDLCEDGRYPGTAAELFAWLTATGIEAVAVVPGNHDRNMDDNAGRCTFYPEGLEVGGWRIVHGDRKLPAGPVIHGHIHPCLRWDAGRDPAPCFLVGKQRLILPAFSTDAAGVNVLTGRSWRRFRCCVPAGDRVLDFGEIDSLGERLAGKKRLVKKRSQ
jgi:putative SbcD/Mre11-related phosphoesterase